MQYRTLENIRMDGRDIPPGQLIDLAESDARQLLESQAVEPIHKPFTKRVAVPGTND